MSVVVDGVSSPRTRQWVGYLERSVSHLAAASVEKEHDSQDGEDDSDTHTSANSNFGRCRHTRSGWLAGRSISWRDPGGGGGGAGGGAGGGVGDCAAGGSGRFKHCDLAQGE